jgi:AcrR family transcriptional regulator
MRSTTAASPSSTPRGRPRSLDAKRAILDAARELVGKGGYNAATIEAVAARSGVAKTTIYRWWPNRNALLVDLLVELATSAAPPPTTQTQEPLETLYTELANVAEASESLPGRLLSSLLGEAECDLTVHEALQTQIFIPRRKATAAVIRQAQLSGTLRSDVSPLVAVDLFFGPLFYRKFIRRETVTRAFVKQAFRGVLAGLQPRPPRRK